MELPSSYDLFKFNHFVFQLSVVKNAFEIKVLNGAILFTILTA